MVLSFIATSLLMSSKAEHIGNIGEKEPTLRKNNKKVILDACCGSKMFWFNKNHPNVIYIDKRVEEKGYTPIRPKMEIKPDIKADFKDLPFNNKSFKLIIWDPPHMIANGYNTHMTQQYGFLNVETWQYDIKAGFKELWRLLEDFGVLIFKFNNSQINFRKVLSLIPIEPLIGHRSNRKNTESKWFCFMKIPKEEKLKKKDV